VVGEGKEEEEEQVNVATKKKKKKKKKKKRKMMTMTMTMTMLHRKKMQSVVAQHALHVKIFLRRWDQNGPLTIARLHLSALSVAPATRTSKRNSGLRPCCLRAGAYCLHDCCASWRCCCVSCGCPSCCC
jgi:hypothetical protein